MRRPTLHQTHRSRRADLLAAGLTLAGLGAAVVLGLISNGVYQDDDITHYLFARDAWGNVEAMLHWWARPGYNLPTMVVARFFALEGCRVFSALQTAAVAFLAYLIARRLGVAARWSLLAPVFVWAQPLVMTLAQTTLTETPAALYLTLGVWLWLRGNRVWAAVAISPAFVTRLELLGLAPVFVAALLWDAWRGADGEGGATLRRGRVGGVAAALLWAPAVYALAAWVAQLPLDSSPLYIFSRQHTDAYGHGSWYHYLVRWAQASTLGLVALTLGGAVRLGRRAALVTALALGLVVLQGAIFTLGLFASGGYARFLVPGVGLFAPLAAAGTRCFRRAASRPAMAVALVAAPLILALVAYCYPHALAAHCPRAHALSWCVAVPAAGLLVACVFAAPGVRRVAAPAAGLLLLGLAGVQVAAQVRPLRIDNNIDGMHQAVRRSVRQVRTRGLTGRAALSQHVMVRHMYGGVHAGSNAEALQRWHSAPRGTLFFWDSKYCAPPARPARQSALYEALRREGRLVTTASCAGSSVEVYVRNGATTRGVQD